MSLYLNVYESIILILHRQFLSLWYTPCLSILTGRRGQYQLVLALPVDFNVYYGSTISSIVTDKEGQYQLVLAHG